MNRATQILIGLTAFLLCRESMAQSSKKPEPPALIVRLPAMLAPGDTRTDYDRAILDLLLEKTVPKFGPYILKSSVRMPQSRALASLKIGELVDAVPTTSSTERERDFLPIRHDIHRGLMGVKLLLVKKSKLPTFAKLKKFDDLKKLTLGQGHDWPDVVIMRKAGLDVITNPTYEGLFKMLASDRFDSFPRGLPEIWDEAKAHADEGLVVEPTLAVIYPLPAYIFVNKKNTALAERLEAGFQIALKDGSFHRLFDMKHGENIVRAQLKGRKLFYIDNPLLPDSYRDVKPDLSFAF